MFLALGALVLAVGGWFVWQIGPRNVWGILWYDTRREGDLRVGDAAPDLELLALDGQTLRLHERIGEQPLVLVFGSFT
ncbi:MAG: hypothetical protein NTV21_05045 [Planctomycetota bacterium]|nr:hypothetical protein [Planctomycetota bacterium]